jgi:hypothetical protein
MPFSWSPDYEQRLVERIALRIAIAKLGERERRILREIVRGNTQAEVGQSEGVSSARVAQIYNCAVGKLRERLHVPHYRSGRIAPRLPFDRAAFLKHMQGLIEQRARAEEQAFQYECARMRGLIFDEMQLVPVEAPKAAAVGPPKAAAFAFGWAVGGHDD